MNNDELMHYGVLGMRWGKKKSKINQRINSFERNASKKYPTTSKVAGEIKRGVKNFTKGSGKAVTIGLSLSAVKTIADVARQEATVLSITNGMYHMSMKDLAKITAVNVGKGYVGAMVGYKATEKIKNKYNNKYKDRK